MVLQSKGFFKTIRNQYLVNNMMKYVVNLSCSESLHRYLINGMLIRLIKRDIAVHILKTPGRKGKGSLPGGRFLGKSRADAEAVKLDAFGIH